MTMRGFKSFPDNTEIVFCDGLTAIVGPNGSGKSNITDAIRWVLGEQSAKTLRGSRMEDVIFAGTETRRPLSLTEVTLVFDNSDGSMDIDYTEVAISRRVYRNGESEYLVNKTPYRLRDITALIRGSGIGRDGYSVIGQGKVDEILSAKEQDRRAVLEEAAGIGKYRQRRTEALRNLEASEANYLRAADIVSEMEARVEPLRIQSEKAKRFLALREELRGDDINIFLREYDSLNEKLAAYDKTVSEEGARVRELQAGMDGNDAETAAAEDRLSKLGAEYDETRRLQLEKSTEAEKLRGEIRLAEQRIDNLRENADKIRKDAADGELAAKELAAGIKDARDEEQSLLAAADALKGDIKAASSKTEEARAAVRSKEDEIEAAKSAIMRSMSSLTDIKARSARLGAMKQSISAQTEELARQRQRIDNALAGLLSDEEELHRLREDAQQSLEAAERELADAYAELDAIKKQGAASESRLRAMISAEKALQAREGMLRAMQRDYEGYYNSVRNLLRDAAPGTELGKRHRGVVADLLRVPAEYERAVEAALGSALQNIVTGTQDDARVLIEHLRERNYGRATFLPMDAVQGRLLNSQERQSCRVGGCFGPASELIDFDPEYRGVAENLLGRTVIVDELQTGIDIARRNKNSFRIATLKGDLINVGGSMTGGSASSRQTSLLSRAREIEEYRARIGAAHEKIAEAEKENAVFAEKTAELENRISGLGEKRASEKAALSHIDERLAIVGENIASYREQAEENTDEAARLAENLTDIENDMRIAEGSLEMIEKGNRTSEGEIRDMQLALVSMRDGLQALEKDASLLEMELYRREHAASTAADRGRDLEKRLMFLRGSADKSAALLKKTEQGIEQGKDELSSLNASVSSLDGEAAELSGRADVLDAGRTEAVELLRRLREERTTLSDSLVAAKDRLSRAESSAERARDDLRDRQNRIWDEYNITYANALPYKNDDYDIAAGKQRAQELRREIRRIGDVNTGAIEEYAALHSRYEYYLGQMADIEKARDDLRTLVQELETVMEKQFLDSFDRINSNFGAVFAEIFGGGTAYLSLTDRSDALSSGVEISAQLPGKKMQQLSLYSGGERSLIAIALLFAMLRLRPTPFCILDEIDAALDDKNVTFLSKFIKGYADDTQFILITHHQNMMAACDMLYGVAMQEKGVSSLIPVKLTDYATGV